MTISRRSLLKALVLAAAAGPGGTTAGAAAVETPSEDIEPVLSTFIDTLLPADDESPAASTLGIPAAVMRRAGDGDYRRVLNLGCAWLERTARRRFHQAFTALNDAERVRVVEQVEAAPTHSPERVFFEAVLADAQRYYYADARSWPQLDYDGPPQPLGFMDYVEPPRGQIGAQP